MQEALLSPTSGEKRVSTSSQQKPTANTLASLEEIVANADNLDSVDELLEYGRSISRWSILKKEAKHNLYVSQLQKAISTLEFMQRQIQTEPSFKTLVLLYELEQTLTVSGEFCLQLMKMLAHEVEQHLGLVPSIRDLQEIARALQSLPSKPFKSGTFSDWGTYALFPNRFQGEDKQRFENAQERAACAELADKEVRKALYLENDRLKHSIPAYWFRISLLHAIENQRLGFLDNAAMLANIYEERKQLLPWTTLGMVMQELRQRGAVLEKDIHAELHVHRNLREIGTIVLPRFIDKLSTLLAILQGQAKSVEDLKTKILAAAVSTFIAGVPVVMKYALGE